MQRLDARLEVKLAGDATEMTFAGYGAVFGNVDAYGDVIEPGAFAQSLSDARSNKSPWPAMLSQHGGWGIGADDLMPIGIWTSLSEDGHGLKVEGKLADTPRGREAYALLKMEPRPAVDGMSIGYIAKEWTARSKPEEPRRSLKRVDLLEISLVTFPANRRARVTDVKAALIARVDEIETLSDAERLLCETGAFDRKGATAFVSRLKRLSQREAAGGSNGLDILAERFARLRQR